jgi:hypothetical protein
MKGDTMKSEKTVKAWRRARVNWMLLTLFFIGIPSFAHADISDFLLKFYPYVRVEEEYNNNILLSPNRFKLADYITTANAGLRFFTFQPGAYGVDMDVSGGYTYYKKNTDLSYWNASGRLNAWYAVTPGLTFQVRDYLVRSDAAREQQYQNLYNAQGQYIGDTQSGQYLLSTTNGVHAVYFRNVVEPSIEYRFGRENLFSILYRNNTYRNENPQFEDSMENTLNPKLAFWFDIRNGVLLDYRLTLNTYQNSPQQLANYVTPRYTYRFSPRASIFGQYRFEYQDFESPGVDYYVHNPILGIQYLFSPTLVGIVQGGYFWQIPKQGSRTQGPFFDISLSQRTLRTHYLLSLQGGYTEDYITAQNLGFTKSYGAYGSINHSLTQRLSVQLNGSGYRVWYSTNNQKNWIWDGRVGVSYLVFRWLSVSLTGGHREARSNIDGLGYSEYSGIFGITLFRPGYQPGIMGGPAYQPGVIQPGSPGAMGNRLIGNL